MFSFKDWSLRIVDEWLDDAYLETQRVLKYILICDITDENGSKWYSFYIDKDIIEFVTANSPFYESSYAIVKCHGTLLEKDIIL